MSQSTRRRSRAPQDGRASGASADDVYAMIRAMSEAEVERLLQQLSLTPLPGYDVVPVRSGDARADARDQTELPARLVRFDRTIHRDHLFTALRQQKERHPDWNMRRHFNALRPHYRGSLAGIKSPKSLSRAYQRWLKKLVSTAAP